MDLIAKTRDDYNKIADLFAKTRTDERELLQFSALLSAGQHILDWGCGNGRLVRMMRGRGITYLGVDQSEEMVRIAQQEFAACISEGWASFRVIPGLPPWPLPTASFDGVFAVASLHHVPNKQLRAASIKEMARIIKPGGFCVCVTWNLTSDWAHEQVARGAWQEADAPDAFWVPYKSHDGTVMAERYYCHVEPEEMHETFERSGLRTTACYWSDDSVQVDRARGKNLVCIARKS